MDADMDVNTGTGTGTYTYTNTEQLINDINHTLSTIKKSKYRSTELLELSQKIYSLEIQDIRTFETENWIITKRTVRMPNSKIRSYLIKIPKHSNTQYFKKCIMFFHGSRDLHWDVALVSTNMIYDKYKDYITVYLQGELNLTKPKIHEQYNYITYGENFYEIRYWLPQFDEDLEYMQLVRDDLMTGWDFEKFYAIGHSNGGVFLCLIPVFLPNFFEKIISHQGGIGWDEFFSIPFEKFVEGSRHTPIYFYTGTEDVHKIPCIQAHQIFTNEGFPSTLWIEEGLGHKWNIECEEHLFEYLELELE